jgi:hypothetical protein
MGKILQVSTLIEGAVPWVKAAAKTADKPNAQRQPSVQLRRIAQGKG